MPGGCGWKRDAPRGVSTVGGTADVPPQCRDAPWGVSSGMQGRNMPWVTKTEEETRDLGASLAAELAPDGVLLLSGDLGSGKTVLAQGIARGLGIGPRGVQSPTFNL